MSAPPNVLLITVDHWPAQLLAVAGHPVIQTPTLDQLAHNGCRFTRAYSECPVCIPARRTLMTGTLPRTHGDRVYTDRLPMPAGVPTLAQCFRDAGYQATAVGKLHVFPQRHRIGFDDVILDEEGRTQFGVVDDYALFLGERGLAGQQFGHGLCNNGYETRPWHLPEDTHPTTWATREMCRVIARADPTRPAFWYLSYRHPHPPLAPLQPYLDLYAGLELDDPPVGSWVRDLDALPAALRGQVANTARNALVARRLARQAFYALCTHIDHQLRLVIGTLREHHRLENTVLLFTSDHGDLLGTHGLWGKRLMYEPSACVPMLLVGPARDPRVGHHRTDDRLVGWADIMPTLLDLAGLPIPPSVQGLSMVGPVRRERLYGECGDDHTATRMIHDGRFKLIYYPVGNRTQLFDLLEDPQERTDLAGRPEYAALQGQLTAQLVAELYGGDEAWVRDGRLVGLPDQPWRAGPNRGLSGQRGLHWPPPPGSAPA